MAGLTLRHIYKVYNGGVRAVNDFNLEIKDQSFVVLVGPSGCGKSTTLRMIAGLENITSGQLYIDDVCVNDVESKNRDIAMVFQSYALYPHMTVFQNMGFGLKLRHVNKDIIKEKVLAAAEILEISDLLDRKPKELSGGQRQRVALGRAIVREPNVFLLDEPLSNLDAKLRVQMRTEITKLHEKLQTTFVYVTHDQTEAMTMGDTIVVMNKGFIQQADAPVTLFEDPTNLFVATFLGSPQMNILNVKLLKNDKKIGVKLDTNGQDIVLLREETTKQIYNSGIPLDKEYLFGIRPDHIKLADKGIPAHVEAVEQLGDETLIYVKLGNYQKNVVIKSPTNANVKSQDDIFIQFDVHKVYLFDKDTEESLIGMPSVNKLPCTIQKDKIVLGDYKIPLDEEIKSHLLNRVFEEQSFLSIKPELIELEEIPNSTPLKVFIDFVDERTNYDIAYAKVCGVSQYLVFRLPKHSGIKKSKDLIVYLPNDHLYFSDAQDNSLRSREVLPPNYATAVVRNDGVRMTVSIKGGEKLVYPIDHKHIIPDGEHRLELDQSLCKVLFTKKMAKKLEVEPNEFPSNQLLSVSCYDEEPQKTKNTIFVKIKGFAEYVTLSIDNNFSVYKMPSFKVHVPREALKFDK